MKIFARNFTPRWAIKFTLPPSFVKIYAKIARLCCFNQDNRHFKRFERCLSHMYVRGCDKSQLTRWGCRLETDRVTADENDKIMPFQPRQLHLPAMWRRSGAWHTSRRNGCKRTVPGSLRKMSDSYKLFRFEPAGLDYHAQGAMLEKYDKLHLKPKTTNQLKVALQTIWEQLPQEHINKAVANFTKYLTACVAIWLPMLVTRSICSNSAVCLQVCVLLSSPHSYDVI